MTENSMHSDEEALQTAVLDCAALRDVFLVGLPQ